MITAEQIQGKQNMIFEHAVLGAYKQNGSISTYGGETNIPIKQMYTSCTGMLSSDGEYPFNFDNWNLISWDEVKIIPELKTDLESILKSMSDFECELSDVIDGNTKFHDELRIEAYNAFESFHKLRCLISTELEKDYLS